jgi:hypothetical protein
MPNEFHNPAHLYAIPLLHSTTAVNGVGKGRERKLLVALSKRLLEEESKSEFFSRPTLSYPIHQAGWPLDSNVGGRAEERGVFADYDAMLYMNIT